MSKLFLGSMLCFFVVGCGGKKLVPVEGTITLDGQPVVEATIVFHPENAGDLGPDALKQANALSGNGGKFVMKTAGKPGVMPGKYKITAVLSSQKKDQPKFPEAVSNGAKTTLGIEVPSGGIKDYALDIQSK